MFFLQHTFSTFIRDVLFMASSQLHYSPAPAERTSHTELLKQSTSQVFEKHSKVV